MEAEQKNFRRANACKDFPGPQTIAFLRFNLVQTPKHPNTEQHASANPPELFRCTQAHLWLQRRYLRRLQRRAARQPSGPCRCRQPPEQAAAHC